MIKEFAPHETCKTPNMCKTLKECRWAFEIKNEIGSVQDKLEEPTSNLETMIKRVNCRHPQACRAIVEGKKLLNEE